MKGKKIKKKTPNALLGFSTPSFLRRRSSLIPMLRLRRRRHQSRRLRRPVSVVVVCWRSVLGEECARRACSGGRDVRERGAPYAGVVAAAGEGRLLRVSEIFLFGLTFGPF
ncbi:hypothetical protein V6Z11_D02G278800 [Gossypium hirsutum]